ncbi:transglycosylase SLT domain-containing protein [uncultured Gulosibacter sp.]|uniref:aggregation-promoting factor C-terminal-like domain-containing protein n=1 Tax=uncultured Gulosibacter sp. TaxID=1339167 RepID=UPI00288BA2F8|nr:transglycosylase SLT domain-containing protein [uncultured Gulosibacter sp.]
MSQLQRTGATRAARPAALTAARRNRMIAGSIGACVTAGIALTAIFHTNAPAPTAQAVELPSVAEISAANSQSYQSNLGAVVPVERKEKVSTELEPEPTPEPEPEPEPVASDSGESTADSGNSSQEPAEPSHVPYSGGGSKSEWMAAAGIPEDQWGAADALISRESGWNPDAVNPYSGACGLVQALPCSKIPGQWNNPVDALRWGNGYVNSRYGSWNAALAHSNANGWY